MSHVCLLFTYAAHKNYKRYTVLKSEKNIPVWFTRIRADSGTIERATCYRNAPSYFPSYLTFRMRSVISVRGKQKKKTNRIFYTFTLTYTREVHAPDQLPSAGKA